MRGRMNRKIALLLPLLSLAGCADPYLPYVGLGESEEPFSSAQATLLDFEFDGAITTQNNWGQKQQIESQLMYTIGDPNGGGPAAWSGMEVAGSVTQNQEARHQTPLLAAGRYVFTLAHDPMAPGAGDADLYVKLGSAPTTSSYGCRPYEGGSNETCTVTVATTGVVHVMVRGYDAGANGYVLTAKPE